VRYLDVAGRLLIGVVFAVAVVSKVASRDAFRAFVRSLQQMDVLPLRSVPAAARVSVATEATIVTLLAVPLRWTAAAGFALAAGLLAIFAAAIRRSVRRGNRAPCRCFGASVTPLGRHHVVRNLLLAGAALVGLTGAVGRGHADVAGGFVAAGAGAVVGIAMIAYDDIAALLRPLR
jgi:uncharacterized membrane protein YphA (DoxX/SURF4 family)